MIDIKNGLCIVKMDFLITNMLYKVRFIGK